MTPSILGLNFSIDHTADVAKRDTFHNALAPAYSVAMIDAAKDKSRIRKVELDYPDTTIIGRIWHRTQGGFHLKPTGKGDEDKEFVASPEDVADEMGDLGIANKSWAYVLNEPMGKSEDTSGDEIQDRLFRWNARWMDKSIIQKRRSVMFNWGDREPQIINGMWHERQWGLLKRMAIYPNLFMIGMHFYGPDDVRPHLDAYLKTCEKIGIDPLRVLGTEFGVDTDAGSATNGYRSRGWTGEQFGQWIEKTITTELAPYIKSGVLAGLQLFTWSKHPDWSAFDVTDDLGLQDYLKDAKKRGVFDIILTPAPKPKLSNSLYVTFPANFATRSVERFVKPTRGNQFVRSAPSTSASKQPVILQTTGERCKIVLAEALKVEEVVTSVIEGTKGTWLPIEINGVQGWIFGGFVTAEVIEEKTVTAEVPVVVLPPPPQETAIPPTESVGAAPIKKFIWSMTFTGTEDENRKALEGINLFMKSAWKVESTEVAL